MREKRTVRVMLWKIINKNRELVIINLRNPLKTYLGKTVIHVMSKNQVKIHNLINKRINNKKHHSH